MLKARAIADELMDADDLDAGTYHAVLSDLAKVNRVTLACRPTIKFLRQVRDRFDDLRRAKVLSRFPRAKPRFAMVPIKLLDVGFGAGDSLRTTYIKSRGIVPQFVGIDLNPKSAALAYSLTPKWWEIEYKTGDYRDLSGEGWDVIVSSLVAHHMTREQLVDFIRFMDAESKLGWFINDLHRHGFAYFGFPLLATLMRWHPIVRHDGQLSIARSYRPREWPAILAEAGVTDATITRKFPFRLCVSKIR